MFSHQEFLELDEGEQEDLNLLAKLLAAYLRLDGLPEKERLEIFNSPLLAEDLPDLRTASDKEFHTLLALYHPSHPSAQEQYDSLAYCVFAHRKFMCMYRAGAIIASSALREEGYRPEFEVMCDALSCPGKVRIAVLEHLQNATPEIFVDEVIIVHTFHFAALKDLAQGLGTIAGLIVDAYLGDSESEEDDCSEGNTEISH